MKTAFLTTGGAAKVYAVTPDTVLKWIKSGKLQANRTAGGHYRIDPVELRRFMVEESIAAGTKRLSTKSPIQYCWEYNSKEMRASECHECIVYQLRAQRCYEVAKIAPEIGHKRLFCKGGCQDCEYYRLLRKTPIGVLIVTDDEVLAASIRQSAAQSRCRVEIADCGYSCCSIVEQFKPDYVVIDSSLGQDATRHLCGHLTEDARIPGVRVIVAANKGEFPDSCDMDLYARIGKPFGIEEVADCISGDAVG